jgi:hypothetical protein
MIKKKIVIRFADLFEPEYKVSQSKKFIPSWYKNARPFDENYKKINKLPAKLNFKACSPFGDSFVSGYMVPLPVDIAIEQTEAGPSVTWNSGEIDYVTLRGKEDNPDLPTPEGFSSLHFTWYTKHFLKIPKGFSALITHPLNRYDLPFLTMSGIVDGEYVMPPGNVPVFFSKTFEGVIPAGTPIMQILLFKNAEYVLKEDRDIIHEGKINEFQSGSLMFGWYKKHIWKKKSYE